MKSKVLNIHTNKIFFLSMLALSALAVVVYIYAVDKTIHNIVAIQSSQKQLQQINARVSDLEFQYISLSSNVTLDVAKSLGFQVADQKVFVSRATVAYADEVNRAR